MGFSEEDFARMQLRVKRAAGQAVEPVRAILPWSGTILGNAMSLNNGKASFVRGGKMVTVNTPDYAAWKKTMADQLRGQWGIMLPYAGEVFVIYDIYRTNNRMDYGNPAKALDDALETAGIIANDRLIRRGTITKFVDKSRPRIEVHLYPSTLTPL